MHFSFFSFLAKLHSVTRNDFNLFLCRIFKIEKELSSLVDGLSKDGVLFAMYNVDHVKDVLSILKPIYKLKGAAKKDIHVVIVCGVANTKRVLKAVSTIA
jgi:hypothetical protein